MNLSPSQVRDVWASGQAPLLLLTSVQERALADIQRVWETDLKAVVMMGRRVGKSHLDVCIADHTARRISGAQIKYASSTKEQVRDFILPIYEQILQTCPQDLRPRWIDTKHSWVYPNGSVVKIVGCEDRKKADRLRGPACHLAIVDEAAFIPDLQYVVKTVLMLQLLTTRGKMIISSSAPETPTHTFAVYAADAKQKGKLVFYTILDATHLSQAMIDEFAKELGGKDSTAWRREAMCEIVGEESRLVLPEWKALEGIVVKVWPYTPSPVDYYTAGDCGYKDLTVLGFGFYDWIRDVSVLRGETVIERATLGDIAQGVRAGEAKFFGGSPPRYRHLDLPPQSIVTLAKDYGLYCMATPKREVTHTISMLRDNLKDGRVAVDPSCKTTIAHSEGAIWNDARTEYERVPKVDNIPAHHFDGFDMLRYFDGMIERRRKPHELPREVGPNQSVPRAVNRGVLSGAFAALRRAGRV